MTTLVDPHGKEKYMAINKVTRDTYLLLSMTLLLSTLTAGIAFYFDLPPVGFWLTMIIYFGLLFLTEKFKF